MFKCKYCNHPPYKTEKWYKKHLETKHPDKIETEERVKKVKDLAKEIREETPEKHHRILKWLN